MPFSLSVAHSLLAFTGTDIVIASACTHKGYGIEI